MSEPQPNPTSGGDAAELAQFGYQQSMERHTGKFASFAVAFAFVSIATGIFTTYGAVLNSSGPVGIWTWPIAVLGQLAVAFVLGTIASRIPVTGYAYQWMSRLANPILGWIIGWISFTFLAIVVVAVDYTIASTVLPVLLNYDGTSAVTWAVTALVLVAQAVLLALSTKWSQRFNNGAVSLELIGMVTLTVLLLVVAAVRGDMDAANLYSKGAVAAEGFWSFGDWTSAGPWMLGFLLGAFTIVGFESAANLAEEAKDPFRSVPRAIVGSVVAAAVLGMLFLIALTIAIKDISAVSNSGSPVAAIIRSQLGPVGERILLAGIAFAMFGAGMVIMAACSRQVFAMARDQHFPAHRLMRRVNPRTQTPIFATILILVVGVAHVKPDILHRDAFPFVEINLSTGVSSRGPANLPTSIHLVQLRW